METKTDIQAIKEKLGLADIKIIDGRTKLERMIDKDKYYLVMCHSLPCKGSTILERNFQPGLILEDLGYKLTKEQWDYFNELKRKGEYIKHYEQ